jgi:hypothetical protein
LQSDGAGRVENKYLERENWKKGAGTTVTTAQPTKTNLAKRGRDGDKKEAGDKSCKKEEKDDGEGADPEMEASI